MARYNPNQSEGMRKIMDMLFPVEQERRAQGLCPICGREVGDFKDDLSRKEFAISGLCQQCQDEIFDS